MTLNDLERRNSSYFGFFSPDSIALLANHVTVIEDRPIMSVKYCLPVSSCSLPLLAITNPCTLQRGLFAIAELLVCSAGTSWYAAICEPVDCAGVSELFKRPVNATFLSSICLKMYSLTPSLYIPSADLIQTFDQNLTFVAEHHVYKHFGDVDNDVILMP